MRSIGFPEVASLGLAFYGVIFFCIWKFYQVLSKINGNIARISDALERGVRDRQNAG